MLLPLDVIDLVLSFLQADTAALKSCTQAHPVLSRLAERHLYYKTTLDIKPGGDLEITGLSSLLSKNPRIRNYVRVLAINIFKDSETLVVEETSVVKASSSILTTLPNLNRIILTRTQPWPHRTWNTIHKSLRLPFTDILQQSSITEVHVEGLSAFPLSVFDDNIKTLSLSTCDTFERSESTSPSPHLESLSIRDSLDPTLFNWVIDHISRLTFLNLRPQTEKCAVYQRVFEACARSLTNLELDFEGLGTSEYYPETPDFFSSISPEQSPDSHDVELPFTLSALSHLEHLTISAMIWGVQEEYDFYEQITYNDFVFYTALHAIAQLIKSSTPSLRQVVLRLSCSDFSTIDSLVELDWDRLTLLGNSPTCPHIDLCISCRETSARNGFSPEEIMNTLAQHTGLMQLVDRGVFSIKPERENRS